jgi:hypothetical protein
LNPDVFHFAITSFKGGAGLFNLIFTQDGKATLARAYFGLWEE